MIYENMHYITYIMNQFIKATKKIVTKSIFYKCRIVVVTCVVILIYMHRIDSDPCANSKVLITSLNTVNAHKCVILEPKWDGYWD